MMTHSEMGEAMIALEFYKKIVQALRASGMRQFLVTLGTNGQMNFEVVNEKSRSVNCGSKESDVYECKKFNTIR